LVEWLAGFAAITVALGKADLPRQHRSGLFPFIQLPGRQATVPLPRKLP
jgi:hypothetical protein